MAEAAAIGIQPEAFWHMTPRELRAQFKGADLARRRAAQLALFNAWHSGAFARYNPKKKLPDLQPMLDKLMGDRVMSDRELRNVLLAMHKRMGGDTRVVPKGSVRS